MGLMTLERDPNQITFNFNKTYVLPNSSKIEDLKQRREEKNIDRRAYKNFISPASIRTESPLLMRMNETKNPTGITLVHNYDNKLDQRVNPMDVTYSDYSKHLLDYTKYSKDNFESPLKMSQKSSRNPYQDAPVPEKLFHHVAKPKQHIRTPQAHDLQSSREVKQEELQPHNLRAYT